MANPQIIDYIRQQMSAGVSKENITKALTSSGGWNSQDIAEAFTALGGNVMPPVAPKPFVPGTMPVSSPAFIPGVTLTSSPIVKQKSHFFAILVSVLVLLLIAGGASAFFIPPLRDMLLSSLPVAVLPEQQTVDTSMLAATSTPPTSTTATASPTAAPSVITMDEASSTCDAFLKKVQASSLPIIHSGDTDATTNGAVSQLQTILAFEQQKGSSGFTITTPKVSITGVYDSAIQQVIEQWEQAATHQLTDTATGKPITPDASGTFGETGQRLVVFACAFLHLPAAIEQQNKAYTPPPTSENFSVPSTISIHPGDTAVSADKKDSITLNKVTTVPDPDLHGHTVPAADLTITANGQTQEATLVVTGGNSNTITVNGLTVTINGSGSSGGSTTVSLDLR